MFSYDRLERLFDTLRAAGPLTASELAASLDVSERTVRSDVSRLDDLLSSHGARVATKWHAGYYLDVQDADALAAFLSESGQTEARNLDTAEARMREVLRLLLFAESYLDLGQLASSAAVSENTAQGYLAHIRQLTERYGLECISKRSVGVRVFGSEADRRRCLLNEVILAGEAEGPHITAAERALAPGIDADAVLLALKGAFARSDVNISDVSLKRCALSICLDLLRVRAGHLVEQAPTQELSAALYHLSQDVCQEIERAFGMMLPACERSRITLTLATESDASSVLVDVAVLQQSVESVLLTIAHAYGIDLRADETLKRSLTSHLELILKDRELSASKKNPMLNTIKQSFPLAFEATTTSVSEAAGLRDLNLSEDEMGYVALHIGAAIERRKSALRKPHRMALVCDSRPSTTEMLAARVAALFGTGVELAWTGSLNQFQALVDVGKLDCDCLVATLPLDSCPVPYVLVDFNLPTRDIQAISRLLEGLSAHTDFDLRSLFAPDLFSFEEKPIEKDALLSDMCHELVERGISGPEIAELVMQRENFADTSLNADFAIPHPLHPCSSRTGVLVRILRNPVRWSEDRDAVRMVFLLFIQPGDVENIEPLFNLLVKIADDATLRKRLIRSQDFEQFLEVLELA